MQPADANELHLFLNEVAVPFTSAANAGSKEVIENTLKRTKHSSLAAAIDRFREEACFHFLLNDVDVLMHGS